MGKDSENESLVPGCEICTESDMINRGFHHKRRMFMEESSTSKLKGGLKLWPVTKGYIGTSTDCQVQSPRIDGVGEKHAKILWNGEADEYDLKDLGTNFGTYFVLSRSSRESTKLEKGDIIYLAKSKQKPSRLSTTSIASAFTSRETLDFGDYVRLQVVNLHPSSVPRNQSDKSSSSSATRSKVFTMRRDSDCGTAINLEALKIADTDIVKIKQGFLQAREGFESSNDTIARGAFLHEDDVPQVRESNREKQVCFTTVTLAENGKVVPLRRNVMGGAQTLEDEISFDEILCDKVVLEEHMHMLSETAYINGVKMETKVEESEEGEVEQKEGKEIEEKEEKEEKKEPTVKPFIELQVIGGSTKLKNQTLRFSQQDIMIGSNRANKIIMEDIMPFHVRIFTDAEGFFWIRDLSLTQTCSTMLQIHKERMLTIAVGDVFRFGAHFEVCVRDAGEHPDKVTEYWDNMGLKVVKLRSSLRYRQLTNSTGYPYEAKFFTMASSDEMTVGRKVQECDIAVQDYEMPAFAAVFNRFESRFFVSALPETKKKGVFLELSKRLRNPHIPAGVAPRLSGRIHALQKGDTFRIGKSQITVLLKKTEKDFEWSEIISRGIEVMSSVRLFSCLKHTEIQAMASAATEVRFRAGDVIVKEGEVVDGLFILISGVAEVYHEKNPTKASGSLSEGSLLGEVSLFSRLPASAGIRAAGPVTCLYVDMNMLHLTLPTRSFQMLRFLLEFRLIQSRISDLKRVRSLRELSGSQLLLLSTKMSIIMLPEVGKLALKGDRVDSMYLLLAGKLFTSGESTLSTVTPKPAEKRHTLRPVLPGRCIFEGALEEEFFTAPFSVGSSGPATLLALHKRDYDKLIAQNTDQVQTDAKKVKDGVKEYLAKSLSRRVSTVRAGSAVSLAPSRWETGASSVHSAASSHESSYNTQHSQQGGSLGGYSFVNAKIAPLESSVGKSSGAIDKSLGGSHTPKSRRMRRSMSVAEGEGEEMLFLQQLSKENESCVTDDETSSIASEASTDDLLDVTEGVDEIEKSMFSQATELEKNLQGLNINDLEKEMDKHPFYIVLKCISGPQKRQMFLITNPATVFGRWSSERREDDQDFSQGRRFISFNDRTMSRMNSLLLYRSGDFFLNDLGSKYGTHLKLKQNVDYKLEVGDVITCSQHEFTVYGRSKIAPTRKGSACCSLL